MSSESSISKGRSASKSGPEVLDVRSWPPGPAVGVILENEPDPPATTKPKACPECGHEEKTFEEMGAHLERHRPVEGAQVSRRGKRLTKPCPRGCGREFPKPGPLKEHVALCDGSAPIVKALPEGNGNGQEKEKAVAKERLKCPEADCEFSTSHPPAFARHRQAKHGEAAKGPARGAKGKGRKDGPHFKEALRLMRLEAADLRTRADKMESLAAELEKLTQEG